jgi:hypothetical protein
MYNLTVDTAHTFFVGEGQWLVHNECWSELIAELKASGAKFDPTKIIDITRDPDGTIVWLEEGNSSAGFQHIVERHALDFQSRGIPVNEIPEAIFTAINEGEIIGTARGGTIYEFYYAGRVQHAQIVIGNNGFIVSAYPVP